MQSSDFANRIAAECFRHYDKLPKTGKPSNEQWTVLSAIVEYNIKEDKMKVVSMGSGSKCLGRSQMSLSGDKINDSHSEVLARRGFLRYIYNQMLNQPSAFIFDSKQNLFYKDENISYHFFSTQTPCGDGSIFLKCENLSETNCNDNSRKRKNIEECHDTLKKIKTDFDAEEFVGKSITNDIFRTGAKCLESSNIIDPKQPGASYHVVGVIRTKPGRGDPTLSVSCSDKLSRWNILGVQGALLSLLLNEPIYLQSIIISRDCPFSIDALQRAIIGRWNTKTIKCIPPYKLNVPLIMQIDTDLTFTYCKKSDIAQPCPSGIVWSNVQLNPLQVIVNGYKQGVTKSMLAKGKGSSLICKKELFKLFFKIISEYPLLCNNIFNVKEIDCKLFTYGQVKSMSSAYQTMWKEVCTNCFKNWTYKPDMYLKFSCS